MEGLEESRGTSLSSNSGREDENKDDQPGQGGEEIAQKEAQELQAVLIQFGDVIYTTTGKAHDTDHGIDTGEHTHIRSVLYRLAPA